MLQLAFNAQGSRLIMVVVQLRAVKTYVAAAVEALRKRERQDETQFPIKIDGFLSFIPPLNANVLFCRFLLNLTLCCVWPNSGFWCCVFLTLRITLIFCILPRSVFFWLNFCYWVTKINPAEPIQKILVKQKMCQSQRGKKILKLSYLTQ